MSDHHDDTIQLERLVEADRPHPPAPDLDGLLAGGRRKLRRQRIGTSVAAVAVTVAIGVPAYAAVGALSERGDDSTGDVASDSSEPDAGRPGETECGVMLCVDPDRGHRLEDGELVSEPWVVSQFPSGTEEVVYVVRTEGRDLATGKPDEVNALMLGYRQHGSLYRVARTLQPGYEGRSASGDTVTMWAGRLLGAKDPDEFFVLGYVEGTPDSITWSTPDGDQGPVSHLDGSLIPGHTAFYVERPLPAGWDEPGYTQEGDAVRITPGDAFPPPLTIHTSDGWSCSLQDCGSVG